MGSLVPDRVPFYRAEFPNPQTLARGLRKALFSALEGLNAPAFLLRPGGRLEHANERGRQELRSRGPGLRRAMAAARAAAAADLPSSLLRDGSYFEILDVQQSTSVAYVLVVLRPPPSKAANDVIEARAR